MISVRVAEVTAVFCDSLISTLTPSPSQGCGTIPEGINLDQIRAKAAALRAIGNDQEKLEGLLDHISEFVEDIDDASATPRASGKNLKGAKDDDEHDHAKAKQPTVRPRESS